MKRILLIVFFVFVPILSYGADGTALDTFLANLTNARATVSYSKFIKELGVSLSDNASVIFKKGQGFIWKTKDVTFTATKNEYCVNNETFALAKMPYFNEIKKMIDDFLSGNKNAFDRVFTVTVHDTRTAWSIDLVPIPWAMRDWISKIKFDGNKNELKAIQIDYQNGDVLYMEYKLKSRTVSDEIGC